MPRNNLLNISRILLECRLDPHPVVCRLHMRRQARAQHLVIEVGVHVGQDRALA